MLSKVSIQRFKKFKSIAVELGPFSILMGENSSGKTTVIQAINLSLNTLFKHDFITKGVNGLGKVRSRGVGMPTLPGISLSDYRDLFYGKMSRGEIVQRNTKSTNQGASIELADDNGNNYKLQIRALFGSFNLKCVSSASDVQNNPELHEKAPLFISGFIGLRATEERVFPLDLLQRAINELSRSSIVQRILLVPHRTGRGRAFAVGQTKYGTVSPPNAMFYNHALTRLLGVAEFVVFGQITTLRLFSGNK